MSDQFADQQAETRRFSALMHAEAMRTLQAQHRRVLGFIPRTVWDPGWKAAVIGGLTALVTTALLQHFDAAAAVCRAVVTRTP